MGEETVIDATTLVGKPIEWQSGPKGILKREWELYHEGKVVATLTQRKILTYDRQATYDGVSIEMRFEKAYDRIELRDMGSGEVVGTVEGIEYGIITVLGKVRRRWTVVMNEGAKFTMELQYHPSPDGAFFRSEDGKDLARAWFASGVPTASTFMLLSPDAPIDPWLMAILGLHFLRMTVLSGGAF
jgi:hypothetical protein